MGLREDQIQNEIALEEYTIQLIEDRLRRTRLELDTALRTDPEGAGARSARLDISILEQRIRDERMRIKGKEEIRDKPANIRSSQLIELEQQHLERIRLERDTILRKKESERTPEEKELLDRYLRQAADEAHKIEGKIAAARIVGEIAMLPPNSADELEGGEYRVAIFDPSGRNILALAIPANASVMQPGIVKTPVSVSEAGTTKSVEKPVQSGPAMISAKTNSGKKSRKR
jgi:hypothetical protein